MKEIKELPIGTEVKLPFGKVVVEERPDCEGCLFKLLDDCNEEGIGLLGVCAASFRSDKKDVIFKAYEEEDFSSTEMYNQLKEIEEYGKDQ